MTYFNYLEGKHLYCNVPYLYDIKYNLKPTQNDQKLRFFPVYHVFNQAIRYMFCIYLLQSGSPGPNHNNIHININIHCSASGITHLLS